MYTNNANSDIRERLKKNRIPYWRLVPHLGVCENTIIRRMRTEMSDADRQAIMQAIDIVIGADNT